AAPTGCAAGACAGLLDGGTLRLRGIVGGRVLRAGRGEREERESDGNGAERVVDRTHSVYLEDGDTVVVVARSGIGWPSARARSAEARKRSYVARASVLCAVSWASCASDTSSCVLRPRE